MRLRVLPAASRREANSATWRMYKGWVPELEELEAMKGITYVLKTISHDTKPFCFAPTIDAPHPRAY